MISLEQLGFDDFFSRQLEAEDRDLTPARVASDLGAQLQLLGEVGPLRAVMTGALRKQGPAVGDWALLQRIDDDPGWQLVRLLARRSAMSRQAAGRRTHEQVVGANLDTVFVVSGLDGDFNPRRIERTLALVWESGATPELLLNKADLVDVAQRAAIVLEAEAAAPGVAHQLLSATEGEGVEQLRQRLRPGQTYALIGSSGVGKSTLLNALAGTALMSVGEVRDRDQRGQHTTTRRQLVVLPEGVLLDTPGLRQLQLWGEGEGLAEVFPEVEALAAACRFADCSHQGEPGCAVQAALDGGELDRARLDSYLKLQLELEHHRFRRGERDGKAAPKLKEIAKLIRQHRKLQQR